MTIFMINVILLSFVTLQSEADIKKMILKKIFKGKDKIKLLGLLLMLAKKKLKPSFGILPIPLPIPFP